jgi:predicted DNA-binding protein (MmcQ/YjbR family)
MDIEELRDYCLSLPKVSECSPFGDDSLVFKIGGKMFLLATLEGDFRINVKCDPEYAVQLREQYSNVSAGYHMNKKHWNTVEINSRIADSMILEWINHSYNLVLKSLPRKIREEIENL